ncbi:MAG: hypothetical protein HRT99_04160 [Mycoplasmatales bacterium]|nr:hypothetical protein [Mycoplasmatales bacterium]
MKFIVANKYRRQAKNEEVEINIFDDSLDIDNGLFKIASELLNNNEETYKEINQQFKTMKAAKTHATRMFNKHFKNIGFIQVCLFKNIEDFKNDENYENVYDLDRGEY